MTIWIDAQLSPAVAFWIENTFGVKTFALRDLGLRDAEDEEIFLEAQKANAIVITKDSDARFASRQIRFAAQNHLADLRKHFKRQSQNYLVKNAPRRD